MASLNLNAVFLGHHGVFTGQDALAAPVDALQAVYQLKAQVAFGHRAGPSHLNDFIRSQSDLYAPVSEKFVSRQLHRQSMVRMSELLIEDAYSTSFSGPALGAASAEHEFNSFKINLRAHEDLVFNFSERNFQTEVRGIGRGIVRALAEAGANVAFTTSPTVKRLKNCDELQSCAGRIIAIKADARQ